MRGENELNEEKVLKEEKEVNDEKLLKVEAGTVIDIVHYQVKHNSMIKALVLQSTDLGVVIKWDCGVEAMYDESDLASIRVFDLGPTCMLLLLVLYGSMFKSTS